MPGSVRRKLGALAFTVLLGISAPLIGAAPAQADVPGDVPKVAAAGAWGCTYPYVCLYDVNHVMLERYQVVTSGFQNITRSGIFYYVNTRNDDVAYIRNVEGGVGCMPAGNPNAVYASTSSERVNGVRIDSSSSCSGYVLPRIY
ncbi:hypothetical protein [Streptosporangium lutulentum]|uniref:Peptidase inhibitor family I36 n=1 Tax=Streptosporangium lutulentum TaxID=1461250 RepID=A0ABT9Q9D9_9ACTN|nr:hypothetical protein [Streptosporangium lutulentum]MDP9842943.1 hypothetical protein [Streptosporangium lutulentum]